MHFKNNLIKEFKNIKKIKTEIKIWNKHKI